MFKGFPADILAGIVNVFCLFYMLYARRMFKLTLLVMNQTYIDFFDADGILNNLHHHI